MRPVDLGEGVDQFIRQKYVDRTVSGVRMLGMTCVVFWAYGLTRVHLQWCAPGAALPSPGVAASAKVLASP